MKNLLNDRAKIFPLLAVAIVIAIGATLVILLASPSTPGGGGSSAAATPAATPAAGGSGKSVTVDIASYKYAPPSLTVAAGTTVTWTNKDSSEHTATTSGDGFDTGALTQGKSKSIKLSKPGTYAYICSFHPFMHGTVVVR